MEIKEVEDLEDEETYKEMLNSQKYITRYVDFENAKTIGITFGPSDIAAEDFRAFSIIKVKLMELEEKRHGRKRSNPTHSRAKKGARRSRKA